MTDYMLTQCDYSRAQIDPDKNSFKPAYQHVFKEIHASSYVKIKCIQDGKEVERYFDVVRRRFADLKEIIDDSRIIMDLGKSCNDHET